MLTLMNITPPWLEWQSTTIKKYSAPISLTFLVCFMGSLQTAVVALAMDHNASAWRLGWDIRLFSALYNVRTLISIKPFILITTVRGLRSSKIEACPSQVHWVGPFGPHMQVLCIIRFHGSPDSPVCILHTLPLNGMPGTLL